MTPSSPTTAVASPRYERMAVCGLTVLALLFLWVFTALPAADWSQHVVLVDILVRLARGDAAIATSYAFHVQPVGYHLFYLATVPVAFLVGAEGAVRVVMSLVLVGHVAVLAWALRKRRAPLVLSLVGIPAFYSAHFAWGFLPTLVATPFAVWTLFCLADAGKSEHASLSQARIAGCAAFLAGLSHIIFLPTLVLAAAATRILAGARAQRAALHVGVGSAAVIVPAAVGRVMSLCAAQANEAAFIEFTSLRRGLSRFVDIAVTWDRTFACLGWLVLWALLLVLAVFAKRREQDATMRRESLCLFIYALIAISMLWVVPVSTSGSVGVSYLLNIRALALLPFLFAPLASRHASWSAAPSRLALTAIVCVAVVFTLIGMARIAREVSRDADEWLRCRKQLPSITRLGVHSERVPIASEWPPVRVHMASIAFPLGTAWQSDVFVGQQLPVKERVFGAAEALTQATRAYVDSLHRDNDDPSVSERVWHSCDALFVQDPHIDEWRTPTPQEGVPLAAGRKWRLIGAPEAQRQ